MSEGFQDINYNFIVGNFGVFEGRGWDVQSEGNEALVIAVFASEDPDKANRNRLIADGQTIRKLANELNLVEPGNVG
jgi:hypothetical protein